MYNKACFEKKHFHCYGNPFWSVKYSKDEDLNVALSLEKFNCYKEHMYQVSYLYL